MTGEQARISRPEFEKTTEKIKKKKKRKAKGLFLKMIIFPIHFFRASGEAILGTQRTW